MKKIKTGVLSAGIVLTGGASILLLGSDWIPFMKWWVMILALGIGFWPLAGCLFRNFEDRGWLFAKTLGIIVPGFLMLAFGSLGILKFNVYCSWGCVIVSILCCWSIWAVNAKKNGTKTEWKPNLNLILGEELIFMFFFLLWTYLAGFHPEAYGTEKFMDYGFMATMMRSQELPAPDIWFGQGVINYYYGGQYYAVFLTKLTATRINETYHLMRTMVAAFAYALPFTIAYHLLRNFFQKDKQEKTAAPVLGGLLAGAAVSLAGNMHYVYYRIIRPVFAERYGWEEIDYWFPNSTRYIGYVPDVANDKTIHEFPSYSFVLGDLHAHVVNIFLVLTLVGICYAYLLKVQRTQQEVRFGKHRLKDTLLEPAVLAMGFFIGLFQWTNYWDFVIYFVVSMAAVTYANIYRYRCRFRDLIWPTLIQAAEILILGFIIALPFNLKFETMVSGVGIAQNHSMLHQLFILWGFPVILTGIFVIYVAVKERNKRRKGHYVEDFFLNRRLSDLFVVIMALCAIGLVLIPELVYVRDIYEESYARSNTMFKLTYQAFILFGISIGYILVRFLWKKGSKALKTVGAAGVICLALTLGYFGNAVNAWFGEVWKPDNYKGLDATAFLESSFWQDASAIRMLNETIEGSPVVLEANGDSYSDYERVSAMTGLPTVLGWYVHEWLWRGNTDELNVRSQDIQTIYTSDNMEETRALLEKYDVSYIFIGSCERNKYGLDIKEDKLRQMGEVIFDEGAAVIKVK